MRKSIRILFQITCLFVLMFIAMGCPVGIEYPLGTPGKEKIESKLIGTWVAQSSDAEIKKVKVSKKDDSTYSIEVLERGEMYALETDKLEAWVTKFNGATFLFAKPDDPNDPKYYHYNYRFDGKKLVLSDMSLLEGGMDAVTSQEALQKEVMASMKKPEFLSAPVEFIKE
ncbi:MAG: hypothetical protein IT258_07540 [Saprospiraceae bacterium]|nr:hypothetical protein [Saprospiraceae bacterium]